MGLQLLHYFLNICTLENINEVYATIQKNNEKSLSLFKKVGGIIIDETKEENILRITLA